MIDPSRKALRLTAIVLGGAFLLAAVSPAAAQNVTIGFGEGTGVTERAIQLIALVTIMSLAPSILIMVTSFTRIVVVLSLLRTAIGIQQSPPNAVVISLALFLTAFVMAPVFQSAYDKGIEPLINEEIELNQAFELVVTPFQNFMLTHVREKDLGLFLDLSHEDKVEKAEDVSLRVLGSRLHDFRVEASFRNRLSAVRTLYRHRPGGCFGADVDGYDDAATGHYFTALQIDLFCAGRWLASGCRLPGPKLRPWLRCADAVWDATGIRAYEARRLQLRLADIVLSSASK